MDDTQKHGRWFIDNNSESFTPCNFTRFEAENHLENLKNLYEKLIPDKFNLSINLFETHLYEYRNMKSKVKYKVTKL